MALGETQGNAWRAWASARAACDQGLVARPLSLFVEATKLARTEVYLEAAEFALSVNRRLERLAPIYQRHARSFGLAPDTYPIYLPGTKIGPEGWEFVLNCLLAANLSEPSRLDIQEKIADVLDERGRWGEALAWRHGVEAADPEFYGNSMAIGRLLAKSGQLADAEAHYLRIEAKTPHSVEVLVRLISTFSGEGEEFKLLAGLDRIDRALTLEERSSDIDYQVFFLGLILELVRQWPISPSRELLRRLKARCDKLIGGDQSNARILLADALLGLIESDFSRSARSQLCKAMIVAERADTLIDIPSKAAGTVAEAAKYARVLISNPGFSSTELEPLPAINAAVLVREQARTLLHDGKAGDALPKYAASLRAYHVTEVPSQYELVGDHKLVLYEHCYYAFPRDVREFVILDGTVYRLTGIGRHTKRRVPAWLIPLLFPYVGLFRAALGLSRWGRTILLRGVRGMLRPWHNIRLRSMMRGQRDRLIQMLKAPALPLKRMIIWISWRRYAVHGVVTAHRREAALASIAKISNVPLASDGAAPRAVRRARLTRINALGPEG